MNTATQIPHNKPVPFVRGTVTPCNDNIHVDFFEGKGAFISTTGHTEAFAEVLAAKFYVDAYYDKMAVMNGLKPMNGAL